MDRTQNRHLMDGTRTKGGFQPLGDIANRVTLAFAHQAAANPTNCPTVRQMARDVLAAQSREVRP